MKFYKSVLVKKGEESAARELYACFGWAVANDGETSGVRGAENSVWLKFVRDSKADHYEKLVCIETRYRHAEAESRYWEDLRAEAENGKPNTALTIALFCCMILPGVVYLCLRGKSTRKRKKEVACAEDRLHALAAEKQTLLEEAKKLTMQS